MKLIIDRRTLFWFSFAILLTACGGGGQLKPLDPTATPGGEISGQPRLVTFSELQADPQAYRNRLIRVTGGVVAVAPPLCRPFSGPVPFWALFAENLRLDAVGFDDLPRFASADVLFTVDGIFRQYEGPLGCGKGPPSGVAWFLETLRVVQPNPLAYVGEAPGDGGVPVLPPPLGTPTLPGSTSGGSTAQPTPGATDGALAGTPLATPTILVFTPTPAGTVTPGGTGVPTASATPPATAAGTLTPSPTTTTAQATSPPTATRVPGTVIPPSPTPTSDGYPALPTATNTPEGYPPVTPTPDPYQ